VVGWKGRGGKEAEELKQKIVITLKLFVRHQRSETEGIKGIM